MNDEDKISSTVEPILGLIFAVHKNAAIGSAQSIIFFLQSENEDGVNKEARENALKLLKGVITQQRLEHASKLWNCVRQTTR
jgi:uncharacterized protein YehS (DUF1456 family)